MGHFISSSSIKVLPWALNGWPLGMNWAARNRASLSWSISGGRKQADAKLMQKPANVRKPL
jgi:hypothetical protein